MLKHLSHISLEISTIASLVKGCLLIAEGFENVEYLDDFISTGCLFFSVRVGKGITAANIYFTFA
jgi:hypothetical protein